MFSKIRVPGWMLGVAFLAAAECIGAAAFDAALISPAQAQFFSNDRYRSPPRRSGGFFQDLFSPFSPAPRYEPREYPSHPQQQAAPPGESSRAPAARKPDKDDPPPTTSIVVMGDGMADWLAYGLEEAFADAPEIGIIRKNKINSGLIHYDQRNDLDWWHVAKDLLAAEKPAYVIMMLGVTDRQNIRERDLAKEAEKKAKDEKAQPEGDKKPQAEADKTQPAKETGDEGEPVAAPEPRGRRATGPVEFRTDRWAEIYSRRIDDTIAVLKSKGVPVFWVGLPSIRGTKSTSDVVYLNDLYRARAERAGIVYIDVWDGFVDEAGKFSNFGPDYEGQNRRLRSGDGVYFTKYGARKLAHYVEREVRRSMSNRGPIALPSGPMGPVPSDGRPAARPLAGPVVPLTVAPGNSDVLLGGAAGAPAHADSVAAQVLVKGEPVAAPRGRADNFVWPGAEQPVQPQAQPVAAPAPATQAVAAPPAASPLAAVPPAAVSPSSPQPATAPAEGKPADATRPGAKPAQSTAPKPKRTEETRRRTTQQQSGVPRPPQEIGQRSRQQRPARNDGLFDRGGPFGLLR